MRYFCLLCFKTVCMTCIKLYCMRRVHIRQWKELQILGRCQLCQDNLLKTCQTKVFWLKDEYLGYKPTWLFDPPNLVLKIRLIPEYIRYVPICTQPVSYTGPISAKSLSFTLSLTLSTDSRKELSTRGNRPNGLRMYWKFRDFHLSTFKF